MNSQESKEAIEFLLSPMQATVVAVEMQAGQAVRSGQVLVILEAMKMEHELCAPCNGIVSEVLVSVGDLVMESAPYVRFTPFVEGEETNDFESAADVVADLDYIRPDLAEVLARRQLGLDVARPDAVAKRRRTNQRTSRENVDDLVDAGSFIEYAPMVVAAQRRRRSMDELIVKTPADGMIAGIGTVNAALFGPTRSRVVITNYDYTVLAGTQGAQNHRKKDRMYELAERNRLPVVLFAEGGGGRPGDTDGLGGSGLDGPAFYLFGRLSGLVPLVGITSGYCFAGNAALLGCCDVIIATKGSNIGMGGPAMIEGGGLGVFDPKEVGPLDVQVANGVVDIVVDDEAQAVAAAKKYLSYFQGAVTDWSCVDQRLLRSIVPENRLRAYDTRKVVEAVSDEGSVLELRPGYGVGIITALARIEGRAVGIVANNPGHLGGAIDAPAAEKSARFLQLCDAFDIPIVFLCDTPGFMVGPEAEKLGLVRRAARLFVMAGSLDVPVVTVVLRKGYGLGAIAMAGGGFKVPIFTVAWPTGEFGGMGLEGAVRLAYRNELAAIADPVERLAKENELIARMYQTGKALSTASHFEIDDVIDPADTRRWIMAALDSSPVPEVRRGKKRPMVDTI
jgi:acetyl-CoA carboxylase carboxyltransferase component